jgi:hypothetical protein
MLKQKLRDFIGAILIPDNGRFRIGKLKTIIKIVPPIILLKGFFYTKKFYLF